MTTTMTPPAAVSPGATRARPGRAVRTVLPRVDIYETERSYCVVADMPGVSAEGLEVTAERNTLVIHGRVERPAIRPDYREFELGDYRRTFTLGQDLDSSGITATLRDGVLRAEIPKSPDAQPKKIPVSTE